MSAIVAKFGGSSLSDHNQFIKVREILLADADRCFVVPSAPGKRHAKDEKVTDMLYACQKCAANAESFADIWAQVESRYLMIYAELGLSGEFKKYLDIVKDSIPQKDADYAASRGEYLNGLILAEFLGWSFVDPFECIFFRENGQLDSEKTQAELSARLHQCKRAVIPGFYGQSASGEIKTFSRGGSDVTGAIVARAAGAKLYENWTDVSGFLMADPRIVNQPKGIELITYRELRELSYMGATVLHEEAIFPVRQAGIPIQIKNTNQPDAKGTLIVKQVDELQPSGEITGIAGHTGFLSIAIEKAMMNSELGFGRRVLEAIEARGVSFEHLPTGIDTMTVVCHENSVSDIDDVLQAIDEAVAPDTMHVERNLALIATVGRGMIHTPGTAGRLFQALAAAGVNVRMIDQGSSEINIIVGVDKSDFQTAVSAIYKTFVK